ncbi:MAG: SCP2 sterol-binding domain-containing protein [Polyangiaceae bacterium]|nr:SCP2 sterol-binding domain-containing protein [Polyangiaceae bacterium]
MATAREKMAQIAQKVADNQDRVKELGAVYKFVLEGEGGGTWVLTFTNPPSVVESDGDAQCIIKMDANDCVDMLEGRTPGQQLFFMGKLRIEGDMGLAMKLQSLIDLLK